MCENYTLCVRSVDRRSGANASDYAVELPQIPKGTYRATFRMSADNTVCQEVRVKWSITNSFDTSSLGYSTAMCVTYDGMGVLYVTDPSTTLHVAILDASTGAYYDNEHQLLIHLEKQ
jgi:hypothetical protein